MGVWVTFVHCWQAFRRSLAAQDADEASCTCGIRPFGACLFVLITTSNVRCATVSASPMASLWRNRRHAARCPSPSELACSRVVTEPCHAPLLRMSDTHFTKARVAARAERQAHDTATVRLFLLRATS